MAERKPQAVNSPGTSLWFAMQMVDRADDLPEDFKSLIPGLNGKLGSVLARYAGRMGPADIADLTQIGAVLMRVMDEAGEGPPSGLVH